MLPVFPADQFVDDSNAVNVLVLAAVLTDDVVAVLAGEFAVTALVGAEVNRLHTLAIVKLRVTVRSTLIALCCH